MCAGHPRFLPASRGDLHRHFRNAKYSSEFVLNFEGSRMKTATGRQTSYALGDSQQELGRLARQAEVFNPFTRQLFQEAAIAAGMRVLDVGSGAGDVSFLSAEMVGPSGEVVGADSSAAAVDYAECRASKHGLRNVSFVI